MATVSDVGLIGPRREVFTVWQKLYEWQSVKFELVDFSKNEQKVLKLFLNNKFVVKNGRFFRVNWKSQVCKAVFKAFDALLQHSIKKRFKKRKNDG